MGKKIFKQEEINDIIIRYKEYMDSIADISLRYNCDRSVITRILTENNVEIIKGSAFSVDYWVKRGMNLDTAKLKIRQIKPSLVDYWLNKGYTEEESKLQTELHLMNTERAYIIKYGEIDGKLKYKQKKEKDGLYNSNRRKEYWLNKGYTEEESKELIKQTQATFSLKKCIENFGEIDGRDVFKKRQERWYKTLRSKSNYDDIQKLKDANSFESIKQRYPQNYIEIYFQYNLGDGRYDFLIESVKNNDYNEFIKQIKNNVDYSAKTIGLISKIKIFQYVFNKNNDEIKRDLINLYNVRNKQSYGTTFSVNGYIVRSLGEKKILEKLIDLNIEFIYDKFYPNQKKMKYDFYLPKFDVYIEYFGMLNIKLNDRNSKLLNEYKRKTKLKIKLCTENKYKFIFSNEIGVILESIKKLKHEETNND